MTTVLVGLVCLVLGGCAGVLVVGLLNAARRTDDDAELREVKHRLQVCQEISQRNAEKADTYYALFSEGAKANAQLRNGR